MTLEKASDQSSITNVGQTDALCLLMPCSQGAPSAWLLPKAHSGGKSRRTHREGVLPNSCPGLFTTSRGNRARLRLKQRDRDMPRSAWPQEGHAGVFRTILSNLSASSKLFQGRQLKEREKQNRCTESLSMHKAFAPPVPLLGICPVTVNICKTVTLQKPLYFKR